MKKDERISWWASLILILGYVVYNWKILTGETHPNQVSWFIWSFITVLNFTSYRSNSGDEVKSRLPTMSSMLCITTFLIALANGKHEMPSRSDQIVLALGVVASVIWWMTRSPSAAQMILQGTMAFSFLPIYIQVIGNPSTENIWGWIIWTIAFSLQIIVVILRWQGKYMDLVYPVNMAVCHAAVPLLIHYNYHDVLETLAGLVFIFGFLPYIREVWSTRSLPSGADGKIEPVKATWIIWTVLDTITLLAMWRAGTLNYQIEGCVIGAWIVVVLALKYGKSGWTGADIFCLTGAALGLVRWWWTGDAVEGLWITLATLVLGSYPLFCVTWGNPNGESKIAWVAWWISSIIQMASFPAWSFKACAQTVAFFTVQSIMVSLIFVKPWLLEKKSEFYRSILDFS